MASSSILLGISAIIPLCIIYYINKNNGKIKSYSSKIYLWMFYCLLMWIIPLFFQSLFVGKIEKLIYFDYFAYIGLCFLGPSILLVGLTFSGKKVDKKKIIALYIIPIISLLVLWTNDFHHLFYEHYSINFTEGEFGPYFTLHSIYSYSCIGLGLLFLLVFSIKRYGFLSKSSLLLFTGTILSVGINIVATFQIFDLSIYVTPISFSVSLLFYALAILKYNVLNLTPIALDLVVNTMSDAYVVLNKQNEVVSFNNAFLKLFNVKISDLENKNIYIILDIDNHPDSENIEGKILLEKYYKNIDKYISVEVSRIVKNKITLGTLIFLTDITQHKKDMETIQDNQQMLIERERLASLGQMVGGIAHSLKTPIFSISGGIEGLSDLIKEFDESIEDPNVNDQDMHDIAKDMNVWIEKMKGHLSYMSEVITTVKGQAVNLSGDDSVKFTVSELFSHTNILMKHELQNALVKLETQNNVDDTVILTGNINSLVQVLNNLISNAIQAYNGKLDQKIELQANYQDNRIVIMIKDYGPGLPAKVKNKLFKEMITTKGKEGTGLGLFMSYSMIKAKFNGDITYETSGNGTTFYINLPI